MKTKNYLLVFVAFCISQLATSQDWYNLGNSVYGVNNLDLFGNEIKLSQDGSTFITGVRNLTGSGRLASYDYNAVTNTWDPRPVIQGGQEFGFRTALTPDGNTVAVAQGNSHVRVYEYVNGSWNQKGTNISFSTTRGLAISDDGNIVVIANPFSRLARVYQFDGSNWVLRNSINGSFTRFGIYLDIDSTANRIIFGSSTSNQVAVYQYNGSNYQQLGSSLQESPFDNSERAVAISKDGTKILYTVYDSGLVRIFNEDEGNWVLEATISTNLNTLNNVDVNEDFSKIIVGSFTSKDTKVYESNGANWTQVGGTVNPTPTNSNNGVSVAISGDGEIIGVGEWMAKQFSSSPNTGVVRVFELGNCPNEDFITITDPNFEQTLIDLDLDIDGVINQQLSTCGTQNVTHLDLSSSNISDLTGIEAFPSLTHLNLTNNPLSEINISANTQLISLIAQSNLISSIDISQNIQLENLILSNNTGVSSLDLQNNTQLKNLYAINLSLESVENVPQSIEHIDVSLNQIQNIDLSNAANLLSFLALDNDLQVVNLANGNNHNMVADAEGGPGVNVTGNANLSCLIVDDAGLANIAQGAYGFWIKDSHTAYGDGTVIVNTHNIVVALDTFGEIAIVASDVDNGSSVDCAVEIISSEVSPSNFTCEDLGEQTVTLSVTDNFGNVHSETAVVTVIDNTPPTIVCLEEMTIDTSAGTCGAIVEFDAPQTADNCDVTLQQTSGLSSGSLFPVGTSTISYTATDSSGNTTICSFDILVRDLEAPEVLCQDMTVALDETGIATISASDLDAGSFDNCGIASIFVDIDQTIFNCANLGENLIELFATDIYGNTSSCFATVTVIDPIAPTVVCEDLILELDESGLASIEPEDLAIFSDNCGILETRVDVRDFTCEDIGAFISVTVTIFDTSLNFSSCTAQVTVVDSWAPTIECPLDQTVTLTGETLYEVPDYFAQQLAFASDNCTNPITITTQDPPVGTLLEAGVYTIALGAEDESGNSSDCSFELVIETILNTNANNFENNTIAIYPNPADRELHIESNFDVLESIQILDILGRTVNNYKVDSAVKKTILNVGTLASGNYILVVNTNRGQIVKQIIKK